MLSLIDAAFEAACCFQAILECAAIVFDIVAWRESRPNRVARKEARQAGAPLPPRSAWAKIFVILLVLIVVLIAIRVAVIVARR